MGGCRRVCVFFLSFCSVILARLETQCRISVLSELSLNIFDLCTFLLTSNPVAVAPISQLSVLTERFLNTFIDAGWHISPLCAQRRHASCSALHCGVSLWNWNRSLTEEHLLSSRRGTGGIRDKLGDIIGPSLAAALNTSPHLVWMYSTHTLIPVLFAAWMPSVLRESQSCGDRGETVRRWEQVKSFPFLCYKITVSKKTHWWKRRPSTTLYCVFFFIIWNIIHCCCFFFFLVNIPVFFFHSMWGIEVKSLAVVFLLMLFFFFVLVRCLFSKKKNDKKIKCIK